MIYFKNDMTGADTNKKPEALKYTHIDSYRHYDVSYTLQVEHGWKIDHTPEISTLDTKN